MGGGNLHIFLIENAPWVLMWSAVDADYSRYGEWAWVGRA